MRTSLTLAGLALVAAGLPLAAPAQADGETCQGKPATIVDLDGGYVVGTTGDDVIVVDTPLDRSTPRVRGRGGDDTICLSGQTIDDGYGTYVDGGKGDDSLEIRTTDAQDKIRVTKVEVVDAGMGAGGAKQDLLGLTGAVGGTVTAAPGAVLSVTGESRVTMKGGAFQVDGARALLFFQGFSRLRALAPSVSLWGGAASDFLLAKACHLELRGGPGNDRLWANPRRYYDSALDCTHRSSRVVGMRGDDLLLGGSYADVLIGGPGRDTANGGKGSDTCQAEVEKACE